MKLSIHPIKLLINQGEHQQLDFKYEITDAARIARSLAAFANTEGGKLLIGVKDNGVIRGIRSDEEIYMLENAAQNYCQPEVKFTTKEWEIEDKIVLEADIPYSKKFIHKAPDNDGDYKAYVRVDDQNLLANGVLLKVWQKRKKNQKIRFVYTKPVQEVLFYLREHPFILFDKAKEVSGLNKYKTEHLLSDLILLEVIDMEFSETSEIFKLNSDIPDFD
jgi:predicted HTH transcriptional regulator